MNPRHLLFALWFACALPAQDPTIDLARALARAQAPARDDVDLKARTFLEAALANGRAPAAALLAGEARNLAEEVADPQALRTWLADQVAKQKPAGSLAQRLAELDWRLWRRCGGTAPADPFASYARRIEILGPFGTGDGPWLDESMPADSGFPKRGVAVDGRARKVSVRSRSRAKDQHAIALLDPALPEPGAHYARWRVGAASDVTGFVEVEYQGSYRLRVDGHEIARLEPALKPCAQVQRYAVRLVTGEHEIVVRTGDGSQNTLALRIVDASGGALAAVREIDPDDPATPIATANPIDPGTYPDALTSLETAAQTRTGNDAAMLRTAAAWLANRIGEPDRGMAQLLALQKEPPQEAEFQLLLADAWRRVDGWPDELRNSQARELEDAALKQLPDGHAQALLVRVRQLDDKDRGEDALRLLRKAVDEGRAGPATFAAMANVCRRLKFQTELGLVLRQWAERCPADPEPHLRLAQRATELSAPAVALKEYQRALELQPTEGSALSGVWQQASALGQFDQARLVLDRIHPEDADDPQRALARAKWLLQMAQRRGDTAAAKAQLDAIAQHPFTGMDEWRQLAERWLVLGDKQRALAICEQSLAVDGSQSELQELRARLGGAAAPGSDFARFRRDGDAAVKSFQTSPSDGEAPTTLLVDQRITEVLPDGSEVTEIHELRRVNDLSGVESLNNASAAASADELILLRTIAPDGTNYVPGRVEGGFSMPRLEPGAFVEWRYQERSGAPGADTMGSMPFLFASQAEPMRVSEYVLILPAKGRGELRLRNLPKPDSEEKLADGRRVLTFRHENVARLPQEAMTPPAEEFVATAAYGEDEPAWPAMRQLRLAMLARSRPTPPIRAFVDETCKDAANDLEKLRRLHAFCQAEIADGNASQATEVLLTRKGDRFLLLMALARAADLDVTPAACMPSRRELESEAEPLFAQGNPAQMPAFVVRPRDAGPIWVFADAPRFLPLGMIPGQRGGTDAWLLGSMPQSTQLPAATTSPQDIEATGEGVFERDALLVKGRLKLDDVTGYGIADQIRRRTKDVRNVAARQLSTQLFDGWRVRNAKLANMDPGGQPLQLDFEVQNAGLQKDGGGRWLLPVPLPHSKLRDSLGDREERKLPMRLAQDLAVHHRFVIDPGEDREFAALPQPLVVSFGPLDYHLTFALDGKKVVVDRRLRVRPMTLPVSLYGEWLRVIGAIDRAEKQTLALRALAR